MSKKEVLFWYLYELWMVWIIKTFERDNGVFYLFSLSRTYNIILYYTTPSKYINIQLQVSIIIIFFVCIKMITDQRIYLISNNKYSFWYKSDYMCNINWHIDFIVMNFVSANWLIIGLLSLRKESYSHLVHFLWSKLIKTTGVF